MKTSIVKEVRKGKPYEGAHGTLYGWWVTMDNGDSISVNTKSADRSPWRVGDEALYELGQEHEGKYGPWYNAKKISPEKPANGYSKPSSNGAGGWSKEKETSVMIQGLLKSIIESGKDPDDWANLLGKAIVVHNTKLASLMKPAEPAPVAAGEEDDDGLPF